MSEVKLISEAVMVRFVSLFVLSIFLTRYGLLNGQEIAPALPERAFLVLSVDIESLTEAINKQGTFYGKFCEQSSLSKFDIQSCNRLHVLLAVATSEGKENLEIPFLFSLQFDEEIDKENCIEALGGQDFFARKFDYFEEIAGGSQVLVPHFQGTKERVNADFSSPSFHFPEKNVVVFGNYELMRELAQHQQRIDYWKSTIGASDSELQIVLKNGAKLSEFLDCKLLEYKQTAELKEFLQSIEQLEATIDRGSMVPASMQIIMKSKEASLESYELMKGWLVEAYTHLKKFDKVGASLGRNYEPIESNVDVVIDLLLRLIESTDVECAGNSLTITTHGCKRLDELVVELVEIAAFLGIKQRPNRGTQK